MQLSVGVEGVRNDCSHQHCVQTVSPSTKIRVRNRLHPIYSRDRRTGGWERGSPRCMYRSCPRSVYYSMRIFLLGTLILSQVTYNHKKIQYVSFQYSWYFVQRPKSQLGERSVPGLKTKSQGNKLFILDNWSVS